MKLQDLSKVTEDAPATLVDPGIYEIVVTDAVEGESRKGTPYIELSMEVLDGASKGRGLKDWVYISELAMWRVKSVLKAFEFQIPEGEFELATASLIGQRARVEVKHELYNSKIKTRIEHYAITESPELTFKPDDGLPF